MPRTDKPPDGLPIYRLLAGPDDAAFCHRVSEALSLGYRLYGSPAVALDDGQVIVAQALLWDGQSKRDGAVGSLGDDGVVGG